MGVCVGAAAQSGVVHTSMSSLGNNFYEARGVRLPIYGIFGFFEKLLVFLKNF